MKNLSTLACKTIFFHSGYASERAGNLDKFGFMEIADDRAAAIAGGKAGVSVDAMATAYGGSAYAFTQAQTLAAGLPQFSIAFGEGSAIATGKNPTTQVNVAGTGDKVYKYTNTYQGSDFSVSLGLVLAIDRG